MSRTREWSNGEGREMERVEVVRAYKKEFIQIGWIEGEVHTTISTTKDKHLLVCGLST